MTIPYRTQRLMKRILILLLVLLLLALVAWTCWMLWLQRFIIYTADGNAILDFDLPPISEGQVASKPEQETVPIHFNEGDEESNLSTELAQLTGYYIEPEQLNDPTQIISQLRVLEPGTAVMMDVKDIQGAFYYSSTVSSNYASGLDVAAIDDLITYMNNSNLYTIARLPALRDYHYGLNHVPNGVHHSSGLYLYQDDQRCYWLNPAKGGTLTYLNQIVTELKNLGFNEVVFYDFCYPNSDSIMVDGSKAEHLTKAAETLVKACTTDRFALSFVKSADFTMPEGRVRMYLSDVDPADAATIAQDSGVPDPLINLVFITELYDTRFNTYSVLRPLSSAH
ncbi:MAG: hypothetical protein IJB47_05820 [Oscillospiraceae bacterium]|nr:hypothetical protein [Oscillospiraceae bacterium]